MVIVNWPEVKVLSTEGSSGAGATASCMLPIMYCLYCSLAFAKLSISSKCDATCDAASNATSCSCYLFACHTAMLYGTLCAELQVQCMPVT